MIYSQIDCLESLKLHLRCFNDDRNMMIKLIYPFTGLETDSIDFFLIMHHKLQLIDDEILYNQYISMKKDFMEFIDYKILAISAKIDQHDNNHLEEIIFFMNSIINHKFDYAIDWLETELEKININSDIVKKLMFYLKTYKYESAKVQLLKLCEEFENLNTPWLD